MVRYVPVFGSLGVLPLVGIMPCKRTSEDGGGPKGTLVITRDEPGGGIHSAHIMTLLQKVF
jgi:hypothetical protein